MVYQWDLKKIVLNEFYVNLREKSQKSGTLILQKYV